MSPKKIDIPTKLGREKLTTDDIQARCICDGSIKSETLVVGFPGVGLVGSIASKTLNQELKLKTYGYIRSPLIPPVSVFFDGVLKYPYYMAGSSEANLSVVIGESPSPPGAYYHLANAVLKWGVERIGIKDIIVLDAFPVQFRDDSHPPQVHVVAEPSVMGYIKETEVLKDLPLPSSGYLGGFAAAVLNEAIIQEGIKAYALLVPSMSQLPDPSGAAQLLKTLSRIKNFDIDVSGLLEDAQKIKQQLRSMAEQTAEM